MHLNTLKRNLLNGPIFNSSIKSRLLIYFISLILLPTCVISITIYNKSTAIITEKINSSLKNNLNMIEADIIQKFELIYDTTLNIYLNHGLASVLSSEHPLNQVDIVNEMDALDKILESYQMQSLSKSILIPKLYLLNRPEYLMYSFSDKISDTSVLEKEKWYLNMPPESKYEVVGLNSVIISSVSIQTIRIAKRLFGLYNINIPYAGLLTIDIGIDDFNGILSSFKPSTHSSIFVLDKNDTIILCPDLLLLGESISDEPYINKIKRDTKKNYHSFVERINNSDVLVSYKRIEPIHWTIITLSPMRELNRELIAFNRIMYMVIAVCTAVAFGLALFLSENISSPIRKLTKSMSVVREGNFDISIEYSRNDEFAYLIDTYKKMVHDIKGLINRVYISEANKREAELKLLQAQINPHFLYNTLDSVNWMAMKYNASDISTMVTSLSDFFRYSLSRGRNVISLEDEKKQVESYLTIQKIRFKDKLDYSINFPAEISKFQTIKLILQPIVENSIIHGIEKMRGKGFIGISANMDDNMIKVIVTDNGAGADVDELNSILDGKSITTSFAIRNVNERIKQFFGCEFGIRFFDNEDSGVKVVIRFPAIKYSEGFHVKNDHSR